jgi:hypothetical protein
VNDQDVLDKESFIRRHAGGWGHFNKGDKPDTRLDTNLMPMTILILAPNVLEPSAVRQTLGLLQVHTLVHTEPCTSRCFSRTSGK